MRVDPHLVFRGDCEAAFEFYAQLLGGTLFATTYGSTPMAAEVPDAWRSKLVHATLTLPDGNALLGADVLPQHYERPQGFYVFLALRDAGEAERVFGGLAEGGDVKMPLQKTFWSACFGVVVDRFGVAWEVSCE